MAKGVESVRKKGLGLIGKTGPLGPLGEKFDPLQKGIQRGAERLDKAIEKKGGFAESTAAKQMREARDVKKRQEAGIARQRQQEELRLAESESEVQRRRFLKKTGGRRSLIASR